MPKIPIKTAGSRDGICGRNGRTSSRTNHLSKCSRSRPTHNKQLTLTERLDVDKQRRLIRGRRLFLTLEWSRRPAKVGNTDKQSSWIWGLSESKPLYNIGRTCCWMSSAGVSFNNSSIFCNIISKICEKNSYFPFSRHYVIRTWIGSISFMTGFKWGRMCVQYSSLLHSCAMSRILGRTKGTIAGWDKSRERQDRTLWTLTRWGSLGRASGSPL